MKAIVIKTGQIIYDVDEKQFDYGRYQVHGRTEKGKSVFFDSGDVILPPKEFQKSKSIDWEQRRYEIAKDMLAAIESNSNPQMFVGNPDEQVKWAIVFADELIKQLKGGTE